jgi:hypothetical protein
MAIFVPVPKSGNQIVNIQLGEGTIWATPNNGSLRIPDDPDANLLFVCREKFALSFAQIGGSTPLPWPGFDVKEIDPYRWECRTRPPAIPTGADAPFYKYTVNAGGLTLDPIVIVDKKSQ